MKIAFVVQRCGKEIIGGSEVFCRNIAIRLSKYYDVEVLTTCAADHFTWKNQYPEGIDDSDEIRIRRFKVDFLRDLKEFSKISSKVFYADHSIEEEIEWMRKQGPYSKSLFDYIKSQQLNYDLFIFVTYEYCTTFFGLPLVASKSILIPTAHNAISTDLYIFKELFNMPRGIIYLTEEEKAFVEAKFQNSSIPSTTIGMGIDHVVNMTESMEANKKVPDPYLLYCGRIEKAKGCEELIENFKKYKKDHDNPLKLVLVGSPVMQIESDNDLLIFPNLEEPAKICLIEACKVFVMPSQYESFSIATLEAMKFGKPVLVNEGCSVLKGHCIKSNGGLYYSNYAEFVEALDLLLSNTDLSNKLGKNGKQYVLTYYNWDKVEREYVLFMNMVRKQIECYNGSSM